MRLDSTERRPARPARRGDNRRHERNRRTCHAVLLLVDGSSYLYRAYHAMPNLPGPGGFPTGAIHGFIAMLKKLRSDFGAEHAACVFDAKGPTFRDDWYPAYKANRSPMPEALAQQIEPIHEVVRLLGWPVLEPPGIEADDAIGTLARRAAESGHRVVISTGDKDLAQLVNEHVTLINTMSSETLDVAGVAAKFGVPPTRIVDYLTLVGDTVDNVPGVDKVGPKTAVKWLAEYGSLDGVVAAADRISGAVGENLRRRSTGCRWPGSWSPWSPIATSSAQVAGLAVARRAGAARGRPRRRCSTSTTATVSRPSSASWKRRRGEAAPRRRRAGACRQGRTPSTGSARTAMASCCRAATRPS